MHSFAEHTTLPMSMDDKHHVSMITRLKRVGQAGHKKARAAVSKMVRLPSIQPSGRDGWIV